MITADEFEILQQKVLGRLKKELSANLTYHSVAHTEDVLEKAVEIAKQEGVSNESELMLLIFYLQQARPLFYLLRFYRFYADGEQPHQNWPVHGFWSTW